MQAYIYIRFSTPKQEKGASKERQLDDCREFCERHGWAVAGEIEDLGQSAWTGAHLTTGNLGKFAEGVRAGDITPGSVLVVEKLDRLSREEPRKTLRWMEDLCAEGLRIATVSGDRIYDDAGLRADLMGTFEILMRAKLAHDESQQKSERVLDRIARNMEQAKTTGRVITAKAPGWLVAKPDRSGFDVRNDRAAVVRDIYEMAADGKGARWIAKDLNQRGVIAWGYTSAKKPSATWEITYVSMLLRHPAVEGDYVPGFLNTKASRTKFTERIVGYYPRVVDADLVARARTAVNSRKIGSGGRYTRNVANLFAGMVFCGACGNKLHLRTNGEKRPKRHWQCNYAARYRGCEQRKMFRYGPFEEAALNAVLHLALDDRFFSSPDQTGDLAKQLAEFDKSISDRKEQMKRLVKALARTDNEPEIEAELVELRRGVGDLEGRRDATAAALQAARGAVSPGEHLRRVSDVRESMDHSDPDVRRTARLRVQSAFRDLGCRVVCDINDSGELEIGLMLRGGMYSCIFDVEGKRLLSFNMVELLDAVYDLDDPKVVEEVATRFANVMPEAPGGLDARSLAKFVKRHRAVARV